MIHFFRDQFIEIAGWYKDRKALLFREVEKSSNIGESTIECY